MLKDSSFFQSSLRETAGVFEQILRGKKQMERNGEEEKRERGARYLRCRKRRSNGVAFNITTNIRFKFLFENM